jgi:hypothetical protein
MSDMVEIFQLAAEIDLEVQRVNASNPTGGEPLLSVECHARGIEAFSRSQPSITTTTVLPDWNDSQRNLWPPRPVSLGVLVAAAMAPAAVNIAYTDRWHEAVGDRRAEQEAEQRRTAEYYDRQEREREAREDEERRAQQR